MNIEQDVTPNSTHVALTQHNYNIIGDVMFLCWSSEPDDLSEYVVAIWRRKADRMKPADWDKMNYANNINA